MSLGNKRIQAGETSFDNVVAAAVQAASVKRTTIRYLKMASIDTKCHCTVPFEVDRFSPFLHSKHLAIDPFFLRMEKIVRITPSFQTFYAASTDCAVAVRVPGVIAIKLKNSYFFQSQITSAGGGGLVWGRANMHHDRKKNIGRAMTIQYR